MESMSTDLSVVASDNFKMLCLNNHVIRNIMIASRSDQLEFIEQALKKTGLSPNALAEKAKINPSTLYRFINGQNDKTLRAVTLNRIARAAQMPAPATDLEDAETRIFDIADMPDLSLSKGESSIGAIEVLNDAMAPAEINPGDILLYDSDRKPVTNDLVIAQIYNARLGDAETVVRYYQPPYLIAAATSDPAHRKPLVIDGENVVLTGVVVRQIRVKDLYELTA